MTNQETIKETNQAPVVNENALVVDEGQEFGSVKNIISSFVLNDNASKAKLFNALQSPDFTVDESVGKEINLTNYVLVPVKLVSETTGELEELYRMVLFDETGISYVTTSKGMTNALSNLVTIYGEPKNWSAPIKIKFLKQKGSSANRSFLTFKIIG